MLKSFVLKILFCVSVFQPLYASGYLEYLGISRDDRVDEFKEKKESDEFTFLPNLPNEHNLLTFPGAAAYSQYHYAIDEETLSIGEKDGIVRFIIVISSSSGVANYYYQGISCKNEQIKTYAYATSSAKKFTEYANPAWGRVTGNGSMGYSKDLAAFYFCDLLGIVLSRKDIIDNLKYEKGNEGGFLD